jgi:transketolase N-terminal domain/subunit
LGGHRDRFCEHGLRPYGKEGASMSTATVSPISPVIQSMDLNVVNTIRTLSMDAVQAANSGHPGTPMALAPVAYCLWQQFLRFDPADPVWPNRDRFVLSIGHASMLLYSLLHLTEVRAVSKDYEILGEPSVPLDSIKSFRQLDSRCPGHPEYRWTSGVETTTGPLGQGVATSVGIAMARQWLAARYNCPGFDNLFDFNVYALCGDGCMMEGVSSEAASLAGHLQLSNLCWIYDNNRITIEGNTSLAFSEDVATRFISYGWNVTRVGDANDLDMLARAFRTFLNTKDRPTLVIVDSHIGYGAPTNKTPAGPTANLWARRRSGSPNGNTGGLKTRNSTCRRASTIISVKASESGASSYATIGSHELMSIANSTQTSPKSCSECNTASFRKGGTETFPSFRPTRRAWRLVSPRPKC